MVEGWSESAGNRALWTQFTKDGGYYGLSGQKNTEEVGSCAVLRKTGIRSVVVGR